jgi:hypothetical protein
MGRRASPFPSALSTCEFSAVATLRHKRYCHNLGRNLNGTLVSDGSTVFAVSKIRPPAADDNQNRTQLF